MTTSDRVKAYSHYARRADIDTKNALFGINKNGCKKGHEPDAARGLGRWVGCGVEIVETTAVARMNGG